MSKTFPKQEVDLALCWLQPDLFPPENTLTSPFKKEKASHTQTWNPSSLDVLWAYEAFIPFSWNELWLIIARGWGITVMPYYWRCVFAPVDDDSNDEAFHQLEKGLSPNISLLLTPPAPARVPQKGCHRVVGRAEETQSS